MFICVFMRHIVYERYLKNNNYNNNNNNNNFKYLAGSPWLYHNILYRVVNSSLITKPSFSR